MFKYMWNMEVLGKFLELYVDKKIYVSLGGLWRLREV